MHRERGVGKTPRRPEGRRLLAAVAVLVAVAGCGFDPTQQKRLSAPCGVVLDGSTSGKKLNVRRLLDSHIDDFFFDNKCRRVAFAPITGASEESRCTETDIDIDPDLPAGVDRDATRRDGRNRAKQAAEALLQCAQHDSNEGSDIVGGLRRVVTERPDGEGTYQVLAISDFVQADKTMSLYRGDLAVPARRAALIRMLASTQRIPDLSGVRLTTYGFALDLSDRPDRRGPFEAFWTELITGPARGTKPKYN